MSGEGPSFPRLQMSYEDDYSHTLGWQLHRLARCSTIHGVQQITRPHSSRSRSCLWLLITLLGVIGFCVNVSSLISVYLSHPVITTHLPDTEIFEWPDFVLCNPTAPFPFLDREEELIPEWQHWGRLSVAFQDLKLFHLIGNRSGTLVRLTGNQTTEAPPLEDDDIVEHSMIFSTINFHKFFNWTPSYSSSWTPSVLFYTTLETSGGVSLFEVQQRHHQWSKRLLPEQTHSASLNETMFVQMRYNIPCHVFRPREWYGKDRLKHLKMLTFLVHTNHHGYLRMNSSYIYPGAFLHLVPPGELPQNDGMPVMAGMVKDVDVHMSVRHYSPDVELCRQADQSVTLVDTRLNTTREYNMTFKDCRKVLSQSYYLRECHCHSPFLPLCLFYEKNVTEVRLCLNMSLFTPQEIIRNAECMTRVFLEHMESEAFQKNVDQQCGSLKVRKCHQVNYEGKVAKNIWLELWGDAMNENRWQILQELARILGFDKVHPQNNRSSLSQFDEDERIKFLKKNVALVVVHRTSSYAYVLKSEVEYSVSEFFSDLGGSLGLWMGLSVVALFELVECCVLVSRHTGHSLWRRWR